MKSIFSYIIRLFTPGAEKDENKNIQRMHMINRIAIVAFLLGIIILVIRLTI